MNTIITNLKLITGKKIPDMHKKKVKVEKVIKQEHKFCPKGNKVCHCDIKPVKPFTPVHR